MSPMTGRIAAFGTFAESLLWAVARLCKARLLPKGDIGFGPCLACQRTLMHFKK